MVTEVNTATTSREPNRFFSYESTPDGDIRTIVKEDSKTKNSDNVDGYSDLFQHHLRNSWDDEYEGVAYNNTGGGEISATPQKQQQRHHRHKHNLSVQFFDISISDDTAPNNNGKNNDEMEQKQPPTSTTRPMNVTIPPPPITTADTAPSPQHTRTKSALEVEAAAAFYFEDNDPDNDPSPNRERAKSDDIANFQKNVHSSWETGGEEEEEEDEDDTQKQADQSSNASSKPKPRHRNNLSVQFTDETFLVKDDEKEEIVPTGNGATTMAQEFQRSPLPSAGNAAMSMSNREARASQFSYDHTQPQQPPRPPVPPAGIVIPVPIVVRPTISRKHRRVYSDRSNPAVAHRRVNTRGDSAPSTEDAWTPTPPPHPHMPPPPPSHPHMLPPPPPPHHPAHPPHPASGHAYPPQYYHQGTPPLQPYGNAPTPPPYDPYYAASQPVDPRYYAAQSSHQYITSPVSDAGVNYVARAASPKVFPTPPGGGGQYPASAHSSPGGYYADQTPPPHAANPYGRPPVYLSQPALDREQPQQHLGEKSFSDRSKENKNDGGNGAAAHHRKQSSFGSFLANSGFEELFEDGGYDSAPEGQQSKRHNKNLSSTSFLRSLSSDNFLKDHLQVVEEEQHKDGASLHGTPQASSTPTSPGGAYQPYPGYYPYGPPPQTSQWQQPRNYLQHSPIQPLPSMHQRHLFAGEAIHTQFPPPSPPHQYLDISATNSTDSGQDSNGKRQRRKCSVPDCPNRVVQGGLCIGHGAKRKTCAHPGCPKNVKAKGLCSTHGPARKRCNAEGCGKVAVQGGRCIAHGAKKKVCAYADCTKQAIMGGMCKKHHDETHGVVKIRGSRKSKDGSPGHERGLSLFTDSAIIDTIISNSSVDEQENDGAF